MNRNECEFSSIQRLLMQKPQFPSTFHDIGNCSPHTVSGCITCNPEKQLCVLMQHLILLSQLLCILNCFSSFRSPNPLKLFLNMLCNGLKDCTSFAGNGFLLYNHLYSPSSHKTQPCGAVALGLYPGSTLNVMAPCLL